MLKYTKNVIVMSLIVATMGAFHPFLLFPLAINYLSPSELSVFLFFTVITTFANVANGGFTQSISRAYSYYKAGKYQILNKNYSSEVNSNKKTGTVLLEDLFATSSRIYNITGLVAMFFILTGGSAASWNIMKLNKHHMNDWAALVMLALNLLLIFQNMKMISFLQGWNLILESKRAEFIMLFLRVLGGAVALICGGKNLSLVLVTTVSLVVQFFYLRKLSLIHKPNLFKGRPRLEIFLDLYPSSWRTGLLAISGFFIGQISNIIISQINDSKTINQFMMTYRLIAMMYGVCLIPMITKFPLIVTNLTHNRLEDNHKLIAKIVSFGSLIYLIGSMFIVFLSIISKNSAFVSFSLLPLDQLLVILLMYYLDLHQGMHSELYAQSNHIPFLLPYTVSGLLIAVIGSLSIYYFGVWGLIVSQLIVQLSFNNWYSIRLNLRLNKWSFKNYLKSLFSEFISLRFLNLLKLERN